MGIPVQLVDLDVPFAWQVHDLLPESACDDAIARAADGPWHPGTVNARGGRVVRPELRDVDVFILRDQGWVDRIEAVARPHVPPQMRGGTLTGIRSPLRIYRYHPGQFFGLHRDQKYRADGAISHLALLIYLDTVEDGGATVFPELGLTVSPHPGRAIVFQNAMLHAGQAVVAGHKHVLRADVMYVDTDP